MTPTEEESQETGIPVEQLEARNRNLSGSNSVREPWLIVVGIVFGAAIIYYFVTHGLNY
jgi:hypothetical protein